MRYIFFPHSSHNSARDSAALSCLLLHLQDSEGMLDFLPGERFKFITVTIVDNPVPELEKIFRVELFTADAAGEKLGSKI